MARRPVAFDMETGDPDDVMTLLLLAACDEVELKVVTLTPGSRQQVELVKWILGELGMDEVRVGAQEWPRFADKRCMNGRFYDSFGRVSVADGDCEPADQALVEACRSNPSLALLTGAPLHNLGAALKLPGFQLDVWVAQGGFAGEGVVPPELQMEKFKGKATMHTWNFGGNPQAALAALSSPLIRRRLLVSKNVCHQAVYDADFHRDFAEAAAEAPADSRRAKALNLLHSAMGPYLVRHREGKKLHDPMALAALLDPSAFSTKEVSVFVDGQGRWGSKLAEATGTRITVGYDEAAFRAVLLGRHPTPVVPLQVAPMLHEPKSMEVQQVEGDGRAVKLATERREGEDGGGQEHAASSAA